MEYVMMITMMTAVMMMNAAQEQSQETKPLIDIQECIWKQDKTMKKVMVGKSLEIPMTMLMFDSL